MRWYGGLYTDPQLEGDIDTVRESLEKGECPRDIFVILPASNGKDLLEFRRGRDLKKEYFRDKDPLIIGVAKGYDEAMELTARIVKERLKDGRICLEGV